MKMRYAMLLIISMSMILASCSGTKKTRMTTTSLLNGKSFLLDSTKNDLRISISFDMNRFNGFAGVNNYFGNYEIRRGNIIVFSNIGSTRMSGPPELMQKEYDFLELINEAFYISYNKNVLTISTIEGEQLVFTENKN